MLEMDLIQTRGFHNIIRDGEAVGFQFSIRLTYYRGIFLSQLRLQKVIVDDMVFPKEELCLEIKGKEYSYEEMRQEADAHWCPDEPAVLKIYKRGGLNEGYHKISTGYKFSSSYLPPSLQQDIDREERSPFLEMMFGQLYSERKLLLVW